jgi:aminoglycoside 6'-N-acetyltransferase
VTEIRGELVVLRPLEAGDEPLLRAILATPAVARWWEPPPPGFPDEDPQATRLAILVDGDVAGMIQFYEEDDPDSRHAAIDVFVAPEHHGRGVGSDAVRTLARHLTGERGHHRVTIDPAVANAPAVRAYEKAGFRRVGVMEAAERNHATGEWQDVLLMELVRRP